LDFVEGAGLAGGEVATVFGEEDRDGAVLEDGDELVVAGGFVRGCGSAPGVGIEAEEVGAGRVGAIAVDVALEVFPSVLEDIANICS
jgi:hypothetical protein